MADGGCERKRNHHIGEKSMSSVSLNKYTPYGGQVKVKGPFNMGYPGGKECKWVAFKNIALITNTSVK